MRNHFVIWRQVVIDRPGRSGALAAASPARTHSVVQSRVLRADGTLRLLPVWLFRVCYLWEDGSGVVFCCWDGFVEAEVCRCGGALAGHADPVRWSSIAWLDVTYDPDARDSGSLQLLYMFSVAWFNVFIQQITADGIINMPVFMLALLLLSSTPHAIRTFPETNQATGFIWRFLLLI